MRLPSRGTRIRLAAALLVFCSSIPLAAVLMPSSISFRILLGVASQDRHVVVSDVRDCADAARLARRLLARTDSSARSVRLVVIGDSLPAELSDERESVLLASGIRGTLVSRWLSLREHARSPVLITRKTILADELTWLNPGEIVRS